MAKRAKGGSAGAREWAERSDQGKPDEPTMIPKWRASGYKVKLLYLSLANEEEAIARVAMRVRQGGHDIPSDVIRRRFVSSLKNFQDLYRLRVDYWQWFDNSGATPRMLNEGGIA